MLANANNLPNFMRLTRATRYLVPKNLEWCREYGVRTADEWIKDFEGEADKQFAAEQSKRAVTMTQELVRVGYKPDEIRVCIKRETEGGSTYYYVAAIYPRGEEASYDLPAKHNRKQDILYMELNSACATQTCEELLGNSDQIAFASKSMTIRDLYTSLGFDTSLTIQQNFRIRDREGKTVGYRDPKEYIQYALKGGFSNEGNRYLISEFIGQDTLG